MDRAGLLRGNVSGEQAPLRQETLRLQREIIMLQEEDPARGGVLGVCCIPQVGVASNPAKKTKVL
jgi:hypothetical protein